MNIYSNEAIISAKENMMKQFRNLIWLGVLAVASFLGGEELYARTHQNDTAEIFVVAQNSDAQDPSMWDKTKGVASDVWDGTKEVSSDVWDGTKKVTSDVWDGTKEVSSDIKEGISGDEK